MYYDKCIIKDRYHQNRIHPSSNEAVMSGWFDSKRPLALSIGMTGISVFCIAFPVKPSFVTKCQFGYIDVGDTKC